MAQATDIELLQDYAKSNSQAAFATLVQRHLRLVYSVALRQLGDIHQAEEVTQAVFIILARKADGFPAHIPLSGWLYQTARLTTANFRRSEQRRLHREQEAFMQKEIRETHGEPIWEGLAPLLDEAMGILNGAERNAIVLRYFEGRTFAETAQALGDKEAAVQKRASRGMEKLRTFFARRGVKISAAVLAGAMGANSLQAAPGGLAVSVAAAAAGKGAAASGSTLTLVKGALKIMAWTKMKTAAVVAVCVLAAGTTAITVNQLWDRSLHAIPADWKALRGDRNIWRSVDGKIVTQNPSGDSLIVSSQEYSDFSVSVTATCKTREATLALRMKDATHGYLLVFGAANTPWARDNGGHLALVKRMPSGNGTREQQLAEFKGKKFDAVGRSAKIKVIGHGSQFQVYLNGDKVMEVQDDEFPKGRIGLRTYGDDTIPSDATYAGLTIKGW